MWEQVLEYWKRGCEPETCTIRGRCIILPAAFGPCNLLEETVVQDLA